MALPMHTGPGTANYRRSREGPASAVLSNDINPGPRSPERRADKLNFLKEITAEQMKTYSPTQIATILEQREDLLGVLSQQQQASDKAQRLYYPSGSYAGGPLKPPPGLGPQTAAKPWVPHYNEECQAKYCHNCRPSCQSRAYLSLDGILHGEVPATAATGFGFHRTRERPVIDARVIQEIGLRPVPWPRLQPHKCASSMSSQSTWSLSDIAEDQIIEPDYADAEPVVEPMRDPIPDKDAEVRARISAFERPRPAFTPPPTPISWTGIDPQENGTTLFTHYPWECDGRSSQSIKTNYRVRYQVVKSILMNSRLDKDKAKEPQPTHSSKTSDEPKSPGTGSASKESQFSVEGSDQGIAMPTTAEEPEEGRFHPDPLDVGGGIAVLEESVELGVPDVITQM
ncbi:hypothetical protein O1611_g9613 [Lasiodiplodia mahajangana]|uniref:Uncharacterized protein n=1 Tax=Lasiodiplodia mahajangana TaxID=1108764 RepID=A0ACC2J7A1_9PEZI|nr:hypothetical protein O1611_g9613 [Lasiodiplodia mahajangana]